jgi:hypothetical protein
LAKPAKSNAPKRRPCFLSGTLRTKRKMRPKKRIRVADWSTVQAGVCPEREKRAAKSRAGRIGKSQESSSLSSRRLRASKPQRKRIAATSTKVKMLFT